MNNRNAVTIYDEDIAYTIVKPLSGYHEGKVFVIYEDAYGDAVGHIMTKDELKKTVNLSNEELFELYNTI